MLKGQYIYTPQIIIVFVHILLSNIGYNIFLKKRKIQCGIIIAFLTAVIRERERERERERGRKREREID